MAKRKNNSYQRGFFWGERTILKEYRQDGEKALYKCDKAAKTCRKYSCDTKITKTKKGVYLTPELRKFYGGIADGMQNGYEKL